MQESITPDTPAAVAFVERTLSSNISYEVGYTLPSLSGADAIYTSFGGAAAGDCDGDGDIDLFITAGDQTPNRLYMNQLIGGSGTPMLFEDRAEAAGVAFTRTDGLGNDRHSGPTFADIDGDQDLDLFVGGLLGDANKLYENRGDCTFIDVTQGSGLDELVSSHTVSAAFGDYDLDGDLDLYLAHRGSRPSSTQISSEHLFRNDTGLGPGFRFVDVSVETGVTDAWMAARQRGFLAYRNAGDFSFTPTFARINDDVWPDIVVASDYGMSQLLLNDAGSSGTFIDASNSAVGAIEYGMGSAVGDYDLDGDLDWFVTSIFSQNDAGITPVIGNRLLRNPGGNFDELQFEDVTQIAGVADGQWGWAACFFDIDNDGDLDIYHTNGWHEPFAGTYYLADASRVFVSDGNGEFTENGEGLGLGTRYNGRGVVCADFDNDGDTDILELTNRPGNSGMLYENVNAAAGHNSLRVRLIGLPPNSEAAGARIFATVDGRTQMREISIGSNFISQNPAVQVIGLGTSSMVSRLRVEWPSRLPGSSLPRASVRTNVATGVPGSTLVICHPDLSPRPTDCD